jgi:hypothetical protein
VTSTLTLAEFLADTGARAYFFDLGRRVVEIPADVIQAFERAETPYPQPFLQCAWLGILFHHEDSADAHHIWFLKLPLDEQGLLVQAARDDFLRRIAETLTASGPDTAAQQQALDDNPHGFTPREERMAVFHAKVSKKLGQPPSHFYDHAHNYFHGKIPGETGFEQWNFVGLQGIADVAARLDEDDNQQALIEAIPQLPATPLVALCSCLENEAIDNSLAQALTARIEAELHNPGTDSGSIVAGGIRGLSHCQDLAAVVNTLQTVMADPLGRNVEVLAAIAGRAWEALAEPTLRFCFLENLAHCGTGQQAFDGIMADLLYLPTLRKLLLGDFRSADCSPQLAAAIAAFLQSVQSPSPQ